MLEELEMLEGLLKPDLSEIQEILEDVNFLGC